MDGSDKNRTKQKIYNKTAFFPHEKKFNEMFFLNCTIMQQPKMIEPSQANVWNVKHPSIMDLLIDFAADL